MSSMKKAVAAAALAAACVIGVAGTAQARPHWKHIPPHKARTSYCVRVGTPAHGYTICRPFGVTK